jgi:hypothetical protein
VSVPIGLLLTAIGPFGPCTYRFLGRSVFTPKNSPLGIPAPAPK